jgi:hypothetical protein
VSALICLLLRASKLTRFSRPPLSMAGGLYPDKRHSWLDYSASKACDNIFMNNSKIAFHGGTSRHFSRTYRVVQAVASKLPMRFRFEKNERPNRQMLRFQNPKSVCSPVELGRAAGMLKHIGTTASTELDSWLHVTLVCASHLVSDVA